MFGGLPPAHQAGPHRSGAYDVPHQLHVASWNTATGMRSLCPLLLSRKSSPSLKSLNN